MLFIDSSPLFLTKRHTVKGLLKPFQSMYTFLYYLLEDIFLLPVIKYVVFYALFARYLKCLSCFNALIGIRGSLEQNVNRHDGRLNEKFREMYSLVQRITQTHRWWPLRKPCLHGMLVSVSQITVWRTTSTTCLGIRPATPIQDHKYIRLTFIFHFGPVCLDLLILVDRSVGSYFVFKIDMYIIYCLISARKLS